MERFVYRVLTPSDFEETYVLVAEDYLKSEAMSRSLDFDNLRGLKEYIQFVIDTGACVGVEDTTTKKLCGVGLNVLSWKLDERQAVMEELDEDLPEKVKSVERFGEYIKRNHLANLGVNYVELDIGSVAKLYRNRGFGVTIAEKSIEVAQELGCDMAVVIATSAVSQKVFKKLNFTLLEEVKFKDYVDPVTNEKIFLNNRLSFQESAMLMIKKIKPTKAKHKL